MRIDIYLHYVGTEQDELIKYLKERFDRLDQTGEKLMAKADEMLADLQEANNTTNELAADVDELVAKIGDGSLSPTEATTVHNELIALRDKLKSVAAKYPVPPA